MDTTANQRRRHLLAALGVMAAVIGLALALWGCAPHAELSSTGGAEEAAASEEAVVGLYPDFTEKSSGLFNDTYQTTELLNAGNRGCNSCHEDLWDIMNTKEGYNHILTHVGYDKALTYQDCEPCHRGHTTLTGPYLGDLLHAAHYGSEQFVEANGNCWSCHAMDSAGSQGDYQFMLWDDFYDSPALGGYPNIANDETTRYWLSVRGKDSSDAIGFNNRMDTEQNPTISVSFAQDVTDHGDVFIVNNWGEEVTEKNGEPFDFNEVCSEDNTLTITGVKNPKTWTKEELLAMPQTEFSMALACGTNGRGGSLVSNIPMSGVSMEYLIEQCGGLLDDSNAVVATASDGWKSFAMPVEASTYSKDAYIALKYYGEELSKDDGAPMVLISLGNIGAWQVKHVEQIDFMHDDEPFTAALMGASDEPTPNYAINGMWFQEHGVEAKVGEPVNLTGAMYSWNRMWGNLDTIKFSFDMGTSWVEYDVDKEVPDFDPYQWVNFSMDWTPAKAGTYLVKMAATDDLGNEMPFSVPLFVHVSE